MLRLMYRWLLGLHPPYFRRRFLAEMQWIFDEADGKLAQARLLVDGLVSLARQWTLRSGFWHEPAAAPDMHPLADGVPFFYTFDPFKPRAGALIHGALLSVVVLWVACLSMQYSWTHVLNLRAPEITGAPTQPVSQDSKRTSAHVKVEVIPTEPDGAQSRTIASSSARTHAASAKIRGEMIWLDPYAGKYISKHPAAKISIQIEEDLLKGDHLALSLAPTGYPSFALSPVSRARFVIVGARNSYVDFTADTQGLICCLSLMVHGNAIGARR